MTDTTHIQNQTDAAAAEKTDRDWREQLSPEQYEVLRHKATERPFTGEYVNEKRDGTYRCAGCGAELFASDTKFDSGTGWPSFTEPANRANVKLEADYSHGMHRIEVTLRRLWRAPGPRLLRRPGHLRRALLHQLLLALARRELSSDSPGQPVGAPAGAV